MKAPRPKPSDAAVQQLHDWGYSHGYTAGRVDGAEVWIVYAHKRGHRITVHAATLAQAYSGAAKQAMP